MMLAENIVHFARVLRASGMPVGPDRVLAAINAVEMVGLDRRSDVHAALSAVMLDRHEQQASGIHCPGCGSNRTAARPAYAFIPLVTFGVLALVFFREEPLLLVGFVLAGGLLSGLVDSFASRFLCRSCGLRFRFEGSR